MGFANIEGVDLSPSLLAQYRGDAQCHVPIAANCPLNEAVKTFLIVQGGLHHLSTLPGDLEQVFAEMHRVLKTGGRVVIVEPWLDSFLRFVHAVSEVPLARVLSKKLDALATMIRYERRTYEQWLSQPQLILSPVPQTLLTASGTIWMGQVELRWHAATVNAAVRAINLDSLPLGVVLD